MLKYDLDKLIYYHLRMHYNIYVINVTFLYAYVGG